MSTIDKSQTDPRPITLKVYALDDDGDFREYLGGLLESEGHTSRVFSEPALFLDACEADLPDVVLLDLKMGEHSGQQVLDSIRERWPRLCVIMVTGYPSFDSMRETFKRDVFDYIPKPFGAADLRKALTQAIDDLGLGQRPLDRLRTMLGRQIRLARTERGWTLRQLSESSGVSVSQLSSIERGTHLPSVESLTSIATALSAAPSVWFQAAGF